MTAPIEAAWAEINAARTALTTLEPQRAAIAAAPCTVTEAEARADALIASFREPFAFAPLYAPTDVAVSGKDLLLSMNIDNRDPVWAVAALAELDPDAFKARLVSHHPGGGIDAATRASQLATLDWRIAQELRREERNLRAVERANYHPAPRRDGAPIAIRDARDEDLAERTPVLLWAGEMATAYGSRDQVSPDIAFPRRGGDLLVVGTRAGNIGAPQAVTVEHAGEALAVNDITRMTRGEAWWAVLRDRDAASGPLRVQWPDDGEGAFSPRSPALVAVYAVQGLAADQSGAGDAALIADAPSETSYLTIDPAETGTFYVGASGMYLGSGQGVLRGVDSTDDLDSDASVTGLASWLDANDDAPGRAFALLQAVEPTAGGERLRFGPVGEARDGEADGFRRVFRFVLD